MPTPHTRTPLLLATALMLVAAPRAQSSHAAGPWIADFDKAMAVAKEQGKDLLVDFAGSDWCHWCHVLDKEVFNHEEFVRGVEDRFVLVMLDYPRSPKAKATVPNPARNAELLQKHAVQGYPTVVLMTASGTAYAKTGYREGGVAPYLASLDKMYKQDRPVVLGLEEKLAAFKVAVGDERTRMIANAVDVLAGRDVGAVGNELLVEIAGAALESQDEDLRVRAIGSMLSVGSGGERLLRAAAEADPENGRGFHDKIVALHLENLQQARSEAEFEAGTGRFLSALATLVNLGAKEQGSQWRMLAIGTDLAMQVGDNKSAAQFAKSLKPMIEAYAPEQLRQRIKMLVERALHN